MPFFIQLCVLGYTCRNGQETQSLQSLSHQLNYCVSCIFWWLQGEGIIETEHCFECSGQATDDMDMHLRIIPHSNLSEAHKVLFEHHTETAVSLLLTNQTTFFGIIMSKLLFSSYSSCVCSVSPTPSNHRVGFTGYSAAQTIKNTQTKEQYRSFCIYYTFN